MNSSTKYVLTYIVVDNELEPFQIHCNFDYNYTLSVWILFPHSNSAVEQIYHIPHYMARQWHLHITETKAENAYTSK